MNYHISQLPIELQQIIGGEEIDFAVKAKRKYSLRKAIMTLLFSGFILLIFGMITSLMGLRFFDARPMILEKNELGELTEVTDLRKLIGFFSFISVFLIMGLFLLVKGGIEWIKEGNIFVGTPTRLIEFSDKKVIQTQWNEFNGNIILDTSKKLGSIHLELKTGKYIRRKNAPKKYIPKKIHLIQITKSIEIYNKLNNRLTKMK